MGLDASFSITDDIRRTLTFHSPSVDGSITSFSADLLCEDVRASTRGLYDGDLWSLAGYFQTLADLWQGWKEPQRWNSLEHQLAFEASHSGFGSVRLRTEMRDHPNFTWRVIVDFKIEPGERMRQIAHEARTFADSARP